MKNHYHNIAKAIEFIQDNAVNSNIQPSLEQIASHIGLSPSHLQRIFKEFAGISPKQFLQFNRIEYAKSLLKDQQLSIFDASEQSGYSSSSRLHDVFIKIESMTPGQFKQQAKDLCIEYDFYDSPFGMMLIANTPIGICYVGFQDDHNPDDLIRRYPLANFKQNSNHIHKQVFQIFESGINNINEIKLHLSGSEFQLKVWQALLNIPESSLSTYGKIAQSINKPKASRAVGTAIGANPISLLIPCHRVIQQSGHIGGYMWGNTRKRAIITWEAGKTQREIGK